MDYVDPITKEPLKANIPYDSRGLPIFDDVSKFTTRIDTNLAYEKQMSQATKDLNKAIVDGNVDASKFTPQQLKQIQLGSEKIDGFTWHHNAQSSPNNMQLIPTHIHQAVRHIGQGSLNGGK